MAEADYIKNEQPDTETEETSEGADGMNADTAENAESAQAQDTAEEPGTAEAGSGGTEEATEEEAGTSKEKALKEKVTILPVIDNFERGLASIPEEEKGGAIASGMEMIYKQLMKILEDLGVKPIEAVGKEFDPNYHNAVMQVESEEYESGVVAQEFIKGYMYHDTVVRHSMVGVVQ